MKGYEFQLLFFWLQSPEINIARVAERVRSGGHHIAEDVIRRRYVAGLKNFFSLYLPLADTWQAYDNTEIYKPQMVATGGQGSVETVQLAEAWHRMKEIADDDRND